MDTQNCMRGNREKALQLLRKSKTAVGAKQLRKALNSGKAKAVFLAKNADFTLTEPIEAICLQSGIPCTWVESMNELGQACGIEVGAAAAAIVD